MNRMRISGGFSLVEMMMLLIIVSLMVASGVSVISKKHVKVPRVAMHGAYICYYNKAGKLHEEKYVGAGVSRKIWDEDVDVCRFVPPDRASYFYVQAVAGGGAGGASGYDGKANRRVIESAVEVISPFGITNNLLTLKGISSSELSSYGGRLHAYANGAGDYGDAGDGGDLYYITRDSGNCFAYRKWKNQEDGRQCVAKSSIPVDYTSKVINYKVWVWNSSSSSSSCTSWNNSYWWGQPGIQWTFSCDSYRGYWTWDYRSCSGGTWEDECPTYDSYAYGTTSSDWCDSESWLSWGWYDADGNKQSWSANAGLTWRGGWYCTSNSGWEMTWNTDWSTCTSCSWATWSGIKTCREWYNVPWSGSCSTTNTSVEGATTDYYSETYGSTQPPIYIETREGSLTYGSGDAKVRKITRNKSETYTVCNYGNSGTFNSNNGIFGSCFVGFDCNFDCDSSSILEAFGDGVLIMSTATTALSTAETVNATQSVFPDVTKDINGTTYNGVWYAVTEEKGLESSFGKACKNTWTGSNACSGKSTVSPGSNWTNPWGATHSTKRSIPTKCTIQDWYTQNEGSCTSIKWETGYSHQWDDYYNHTKWVTPTYTCEQKDFSYEWCMYNVGEMNDSWEWAFMVDVASGEDGGEGKQCALSSGAGTGLTYKGWSAIVPGINGSDKIVSSLVSKGSKYKYLICANCKADWETWKNQPNTYAENGTDSVGAAHITLGNATCDLHATQNPTKGHGACLRNEGSNPIAYNGSSHTECEATGDYWASGPKDGTCAGSGCGSTPPSGCSNGSFVGYCLVAYSGGTKPFGKYTYQYTWARNNLAYGDPGKPGEYKSMVIRSFKDRDMIVIPGKGGEIGGCTGGSGQDTLIYSVPRGAEVDNVAFVTDVEGVELMLDVKGGRGGSGCHVTPTEQLPYHFSAPWPKNGKAGGKGTSPTFNQKSNIMGLVLPLDDSVLGKWLSYSGASGDGGGSQNNCWVSSWARWFEGQPVKGNVGYWRESDVPCINDWYSIPPTKGIAGAVLIKW